MRSRSVLLGPRFALDWNWRKQRKEQSHAQCHVTYRIRIFDKISEHVKVAKSLYQRFPLQFVVYICQKFVHLTMDNVKFLHFVSK